MVLRLCLSTRLGFRKSFARSKTTVFGRAFYKKLVVSRGKAFGRSSQRAKSFIVRHIFESSKGALLGCHRQFCPILYGQKEQTPDWKQVFNPLFCKRKGSRKPIVSREQPQKLSGGWFLTRLSLDAVSRFSFVWICSFSTRSSLALAHLLVERKQKFLFCASMKKHWILHCVVHHCV